MKRVTFPIKLVGEKYAGTYVLAKDAYLKILDLEMELQEALAIIANHNTSILENKSNE